MGSVICAGVVRGGEGIVREGDGTPGSIGLYGFRLLRESRVGLRHALTAAEQEPERGQNGCDSLIFHGDPSVSFV